MHERLPGQAIKAAKTITRFDLNETVYRKVRLTSKEPANLVEQILAEICDSLVAGVIVTFSGVGNFLMRSKAQRVGRYPKLVLKLRLPCAGSWCLNPRLLLSPM